eukprot:GGOE01041058.1.p1 GENE.GGOE01041058.1~~GGOE01041058.1.p1  ORF type:complete len:368 (-),score=68.33 GGOE01041058.1:268-1371(-)
MKILQFINFSFLFILSCAEGVHHFDVVRPVRSWVTDLGGYLSLEAVREINLIIGDIKKELGYEIGLALLSGMHPKEAGIKEFTENVFNHWGIGAQGKQNGILMLLSINDRVMRIQTGAGSKEALSDFKCQNVIEEMKPFLKREDYDGACIHGFRLINDVLRGRDEFSEGGVGGHLWIVAFIALAGFLFYGHCSHLARRRHFERRLQRLSSPEFAKRLRYEAQICAICLEELPSDKKADALPPGSILLRCGHPFHTACITGWLAQKDSCPVCRRDNPTGAEASTDLPPLSSGSEAELVHSHLEAIYLLQVSLFDDVAGEYDLRRHEWDGDAFRVEYHLCDSVPSGESEDWGAFGGGSCDGGGGADGGW